VADPITVDEQLGAYTS